MTRRLSEVEIGLWYEAGNLSQRFEVVAMDNADHTIEIQYADGTLEEIDYESWSSLDAEDCSPPDDDSGVFDIDPGEADVDALLMRMDADDGPDIEQIGFGDTLY